MPFQRPSSAILIFYKSFLVWHLYFLHRKNKNNLILIKSSALFLLCPYFVVCVYNTWSFTQVIAWKTKMRLLTKKDWHNNKEPFNPKRNPSYKISNVFPNEYVAPEQLKMIISSFLKYNVNIPIFASMRKMLTCTHICFYINTWTNSRYVGGINKTNKYSTDALQNSFFP